jgi:molybdenum cofactor biosynthesis enzyme MoaA
MTKNVGELVDRYNVKEAIILGGEPTLHPNICNVIHGLKYAGIEIVRLTTNGIALTDQLLKDMVAYVCMV